MISQLWSLAQIESSAIIFGTVECQAFPDHNRGAAPTTRSPRLLNGLEFDFRLQGCPSAG
jgi:hypothetical protein